jgi:hypothetical protein
MARRKKPITPVYAEFTRGFVLPDLWRNRFYSMR